MRLGSRRASLAWVTALSIVLTAVAVAQSQEPPLSDERLAVHTLLREDLFAGFLANDLERFARGEKNIDLLLEKRPAAKASLLALKAGAVLYRAVRAHEADRRDEFEKQYRHALELFSQARQLGPLDPSVAAVTGGCYVLFADRLPKEHRALAWTQAYEAYQLLWKQQAPILEQLPVHMRGELLGGLAVSAQRTGRTQEVDQHLERMLAVLRDTPYEPVAKQWKANPEAAATRRITCLTCHDAGRLSNRLSVLNKK